MKELSKEEKQDFFQKVEKINDVSILRDIKQFYENEYSGFISDFNNLNQKISSLFNLSAMFLGYFLTVFIFLQENHYFSSLTCIRKMFFVLFVLSLILLLIFTFRIFLIQKFKEGYKRIDSKYPVYTAYENKFFKKDREKEFLIQIIFNYYITVVSNNSLLDDHAQKLKGKHTELTIYICIILINLFFYLKLGGL